MFLKSNLPNVVQNMTLKSIDLLQYVRSFYLLESLAEAKSENDAHNIKKLRLKKSNKRKALSK